MTVKVESVVHAPDLLGEGPIYDESRSRLLWVDVFANRIRQAYRVNGRWEPGEAVDVGELVSVVIPRASGGLLGLMGKRVVSLTDEGKELGTFAQLDDIRPSVRFNDAKCDPNGHLVAGWVSLDGSTNGAVVRVTSAGQIETIVQDVGAANGLDWSPDGNTFYLVDTRALHVEAFDYVGSGSLGGRRVVLTIERGIGAPDGMAVDHEGCLWVAIPYSGEVRRYSPDGDLLSSITTPTLLPTSCAFGGPSGCDLFITSQTQGLAPMDSENSLGISLERVRAAWSDEAAGGLFVCRPGVTGPAATPFSG